MGNPADAIDSGLDSAGNAAENIAQPATDALEKTKEIDHVMDSDIVQQGFPAVVMGTLGGGALGAAGAGAGEAAGEAGFAGESSAGAGTTASGASSTSGSFAAGAGGPSGLDAPVDSGLPGDPAGQSPGGIDDTPTDGTMGPPPMPAAQTMMPPANPDPGFGADSIPDPAPIPGPADATPTDANGPAQVLADGTTPVSPIDSPPAPAPAPSVVDSATTGGEMFSGGGGSSAGFDGFGGGVPQGAGVDGEAGFAGEGSPSMGDPAGSAGSGSVLDNIDTAKVEKALGLTARYGPLGLGAYGMYAQKQAQNKAAEAAKRAGAPDSLAGVGDTQRSVGKDLVGQAQSGNINASDKTNIDNWEQSSIAQARAFYAKAGLSDSSMATNAEADIKARSTAMREQARQNLLQQGLDALNVTDKFTADAIRAQAAGDQQAAAQATKFLESYGRWLDTMPKLTGGTA